MRGRLAPSNGRSAEPSCEKPSCLHLPIWLSNEENAVSWKIMKHSLMLASGNIAGPSSSFTLLMKMRQIILQSLYLSGTLDRECERKGTKSVIEDYDLLSPEMQYFPKQTENFHIPILEKIP
ncbi:hypothetical protein BTVI_126220 [Pitangus sulphuratus]|nr:hypothetical protein BTVI_126220 [Pitangus sulphuratus]